MSTSRNTIAAGQRWRDITAWDNHWIDRLGAEVDALSEEPRDMGFSWLTIVSRARKTNDMDLMAFAIGQAQDIVSRETKSNVEQQWT